MSCVFLPKMIIKSDYIVTFQKIFLCNSCQTHIYGVVDICFSRIATWMANQGVLLKPLFCEVNNVFSIFSILNICSFLFLHLIHQVYKIINCDILPLLLFLLSFSAFFPMSGLFKSTCINRDMVSSFILVNSIT